jgi:hypothetical protein
MSVKMKVYENRVLRRIFGPFSSDTTTLHGFWSSTRDYSRIFYLELAVSYFSVLTSVHNLLLHLSVYFYRLLVLVPNGFQSVIFLNSFISFILFRCSHHFIACNFIFNSILYLKLTETTYWKEDVQK